MEILGYRKRISSNFKKSFFILCIALLFICISAAGFSSAPGELWHRVVQTGEIPSGIHAYTGTKYTARANHASVVFDDKAWIIGGKGADLQVRNDVAYSADGESWTTATAHANFPARKDFGLLSFGGKMWVIGGNNGTANLTDVWNSTDGIIWNQTTAAAYSVNDICNAFIVFEGKMWAFGYNSSEAKSKVFNSTDGITWNSITNDATFNNYIKAIEYAGKIIIIGGCDAIGGGSAEAWSSSNGASWTHTVNIRIGYRYGFELQVYNALLCIFGGQILDGASTKLADDILSTYDVKMWNLYSLYPGFASRINPAAVIFKNNICMYGGNQAVAVTGTFTPLNDIWATCDGKNWIENNVIQGIPSRKSVKSVVHNNKIWLVGGFSKKYTYNCFGYFNDVWSSSDGSNWECVNDNAGFSKRSGHTLLEFNDQMWVIGGTNDSGYLNDIYKSTDGDSWTTSTATAQFSPRANHTSVVFNDKMWVIGGESESGFLNDVWCSSDGDTWTTTTATAAFTPRAYHSSVVYDGKIWVIGGEDDLGSCNDVWYSSDGANWFEATSDAAFDPRFGHTSFVYNNKMWVVNGYNYGFITLSFSYCDVWSSQNGITWTQETPNANIPSRNECASVVFNNSMWMLHGNGNEERNDIWRSNDGINWTYISGYKNFSARTFFSGTVFQDKMWIMGGCNMQGSYFASYGADIWNSSNGTDWLNVVSGKLYLVKLWAGVVEFKNSLFMIGGGMGWDADEVWKSGSGYEWTSLTTSAEFGTKYGHTTLVYNDKLWVIAGEDDNEVWYSDEGDKWTSATLSAAFSQRQHHSSVVFDNKMWVIGGKLGSAEKNDVWSSTDGITWTPATLSAAFPARHGHNTIVSDGYMWLFGGVTSSGESFNDVWRSNDGATWTEVVSTKKYKPTAYFSCFAYDDKFWIIGGSPEYFEGSDDIYVSGSGPNAQALPAALNFGSFNIYDGAAAPLTATVSNALPFAFDPFTITNVTIANDATGAFSISGSAYTGSMAIGDSKDYSILFNPSVTGIATADLVITTTDPKKLTITIPLSGTGIKPSASASPSSLNFGTFNIDEGTTGPLMVTVSNPSPAASDALHIISAAILNDTTGAFSFSSPAYTGALSVDASKDYGILFDPTISGSATANLVITTDDPNMPTITIPLSGNGTNNPSGIKDWMVLY